MNPQRPDISTAQPRKRSAREPKSLRRLEYERQYRAANKEQISARARAHHLANKETINERSRKYRRENPQKHRAYYQANKDKIAEQKREKLYGLSKQQQQHLMEAQCGACEVCGMSLMPGRKTHLDHNHTTGEARAFLCQGCNQAVGNLQENPAIARSLAEYLELHSTGKVLG